MREQVRYHKRPEGDLLCQRVGEELVVYDQKSGQVHLLAPPLARVFETAQECQAEHLSADLFPELKRKTARSRLEESLEALAEQGLLLRPELPQAPGLSRREFHKKVAAAAALPAILTLVAPTPAAAQSTCGTPLTFDADDTVTVPPCATRVQYSIIGGSGGGGGGGGAGFRTGETGGGGGAGALGAMNPLIGTASGMVTMGETLTIMVGTGGAGGLAGSNAPLSNMGGAGGLGGAGGTPSGSPGAAGSMGANGSNMGAGGGGGGGGSGGTTTISSTTLGTVSAQGGRGGGGGEGGGNSTSGDSGDAGALGGAGGSGSTSDGGDGGNGGAGNSSGTGGGGGTAGMDGTAGMAGSVTITFLP